jgi:Fic-DOC domain mobile mystery protein B
MRWRIDPGETPIDPQELSALKVRSLKTQQELNHAEGLNIARAELYINIEDRHRTFEFEWLVKLHRNMFGEVWDWAGQLRKTDKNIGVDFTQIRSQMVQLIQNSKLRLELGEDREEIATVFHHGLLFIHPFPNGNGRWARRVTEAQSDSFSIRLPSWVILAEPEVAKFRADYIAALRLADRGDFEALNQLLFPKR